MDEPTHKKRVRDASDEFGSSDSPEVKRLREELLENLDDTDACASQNLDSFMKSFEEEISASPSRLPPAAEDSAPDSSHFQPELGYLLEASDDELGLPPSNGSPTAEESREDKDPVRISSDSPEFSQLWSFEDQIPSYDSFEFGAGEPGDCDNGAIDYVALDGLFDYSDLGFGSSENLHRSETLPAQ